MSNFRPTLPPGVFANPPRWRVAQLRADADKSFGWGVDVERRPYDEDSFSPGALVHAWASVKLTLCLGRRALMLYRWREKLAGV